MKEKLRWAKEHKKELLIGAGCFVGGTVLVAIGVKCTRKTNSVSMDTITSAIDKAVDSAIEATLNMVSSVHESSDPSIAQQYCVDLEAIPIKDLGNIGKNFLDAIPEAREDTVVQVIAYIENKDL
ncbi:MAG: hypothetical protein LUE29_09490 [Lachnospiraceae bacterium]|nr:hypothetical protein [Lachnospiraceae bacterium]